MSAPLTERALRAVATLRLRLRAYLCPPVLESRPPTGANVALRVARERRRIERILREEGMTRRQATAAARRCIASEAQNNAE